MGAISTILDWIWLFWIELEKVRETCRVPWVRVSIFWFWFSLWSWCYLFFLGFRSKKKESPVQSHKEEFVYLWYGLWFWFYLVWFGLDGVQKRKIDLSSAMRMSVFCLVCYHYCILFFVLIQFDLLENDLSSAARTGVDFSLVFLSLWLWLCAV